MGGNAPGTAAEMLRAHQLLELGRPAQALEIAAVLLAAEPRDAAVLRLAARCRMALGEDVLAVAMAREAVAADPDSEHGFRILAETLRRIGNHQEAVAAARRAVRIAPTESRAHLQLAQCLYRVDAREALAAAERSCELRPSVPGSHYLRGALLRRLNRRDEARAAFLEALRLDPQHAGAMTALAMADRGIGAWRGRLHGIQRALGASPHSTASLHALENLILSRLWRLGVLGMFGVQIAAAGGGSAPTSGTRPTAVAVLVLLIAVLWFSLWPARADLGLFGWRLLRSDRRAVACEAVIGCALLLIGAAAIVPGAVGSLPYLIAWGAMTMLAVWGLYQLRAVRRGTARSPDTL